jgi:hypothetical protein
MNRDELIKFLTDSGCVVVRNDKQGYSVIRNVMNGKISGVPREDFILSATVCRICKTLDIESPEEVKSAQSIVDLAHKNHGAKE